MDVLVLIICSIVCGIYRPRLGRQGFWLYAGLVASFGAFHGVAYVVDPPPVPDELQYLFGAEGHVTSRGLVRITLSAVIGGIIYVGIFSWIGEFVGRRGMRLQSGSVAAKRAGYASAPKAPQDAFVRFRCCQCNTELSAIAGKAFECTECGELLRVPASNV
jgi:hypothetical protein